ncbi:unnamed protein product [Amoebophrya sp. A25]|nr:unnamed protein product [Amoebophrya sp. A25]|eukprot:GSA25T00025946001.1
MGNKVSASYDVPIDCPAEMLNPFQLRYSKRGMLDGLDNIAGLQNKLKLQFDNAVADSVMPTLRQGLAAEDAPRVRTNLLHALDTAKSDSLALYCALQKEARIAMAGIPDSSGGRRAPLWRRLSSDLRILENFVSAGLRKGSDDRLETQLRTLREKIEHAGQMHQGRTTPTELEHFLSTGDGALTSGDRRSLLNGVQEVSSSAQRHTFLNGASMPSQEEIEQTRVAAMRIREMLRVLPTRDRDAVPL